jgi:hypothetical protein
MGASSLNKESLANHVLRRWDATALVLLGALVLTWFRGPGVIYGVDSYFVLDPAIGIRLAMSGWNDLYSAGIPNFAPHTLIFYCTFGVLNTLFGFRVAQIIILWLLISSAGLGIRAFLAKIITPSDLATRTAILAASILYVVNPFTTSYVWWHQTWMELTWAAVPWLLAFLVDAQKAARPPVLIATYGTLLIVVAAPAFSHPLLPQLVLFFVAAGLAFILDSEQRATTARRILIFFGGLAVGLSWWLVPSLLYVRTFLKMWHAQYNTPPVALLSYVSQFTTLPNVIRYIGLPQLHLYVGSEPFCAWFNPFRAGLLNELLFALPALTVGGFVVAGSGLAPEVKRHRCFFAFCATTWLTSLFLMKGANPPLAGLNESLLKLPLGAAWQHPYDKFAQISLLAATPALVLALRIPLRSPWLTGRILGGVAILAFLLLEGWPFYYGNLLTQQTPRIPGGVMVIPAEYRALAPVLRGQQGFTLQLPFVSDGETAFNWRRGAQTNNDPILEYFNGLQPVIRMRTGNVASDALVDLSRLALASPRSAYVYSALGVSAVVVHHDWAQQFLPASPDPEALEEYLDPLRPPSIAARLVSNRNSQALPLLTSGLTKLLTPPFRLSMFVQLRQPAQFPQTLIATDGGTILRWVSPGYLDLYDQTSKSRVYTNRIAMRRGQWFKLELDLLPKYALIRVDDVLEGAGPFSAAPSRQVFVGSINGFYPFEGTLVAPTFDIGQSRHTFTGLEPDLQARIRHFGWKLQPPAALGSPPTTGGFALIGSAYSGPLELGHGVSFGNLDISMFVRLDRVSRRQVLISSPDGFQLVWQPEHYVGAVLPMERGGYEWVYTDPLYIRPQSWLQVRLLSRRGAIAIFVDGVPLVQAPYPSAGHGSLFLGNYWGVGFLGSVADLHMMSKDGTLVAVRQWFNEAHNLSSQGWQIATLPRRFQKGYLFVPGIKLHVFLTPCPVGPIFIAPSTVTVRGDALAIIRALSHTSSCSRKVTVMSYPSQLIPTHLSSPHLVVRSIFPIGYDVAITGAGSYVLVFNRAFSTDWDAIPKYRRARILAHLEVNGFANGYLITGGDDIIQLRYKDQQRIWLTLTAGALIVCVAIGVLLITRRHNPVYPSRRS